ncbi:hypothetical protein TcasGA2_TC033654 [Tribolium castaneum]|uniref:Uncharacterized protein n=1 Tax=Tribolium castaneum TaxID=7070 RepID=A0A139WFH5_TRICA|nr:hypothetical protein TcasGA2_TC033654 [Tribolium castaneum]
MPRVEEGWCRPNGMLTRTVCMYRVWQFPKIRWSKEALQLRLP